jgi:hypothetical protein
VALAARQVEHPKYHGILFRRTFPQLQEIIDRCWDRYPSIGGIYKATLHRWEFPSGAKISLSHMQHEDDKYNHQGKEYQFMGFDELTQFTETQYTYLVGSRGRTSAAGLPVRVRSTTNPGGIGHRWVKKRFRISEIEAGQIFLDPDTGLSRVFIPGSLERDNPTLLENDPGYLKRLDALPDLERRRLKHGDWDTFEGQMFGSLSTRTHGCDPFDIPPEWERFMVMDWGFARPFSIGWYAVDYDGVLYRYREWYGCKEGEINVGLRMTATEVALGILRIEAENRDTCKIRVGDPSIWHKRPQFRAKEALGATIEEDMAGQGVYFLKADNERIQGLQQCHKRFKMDLDVDTDTGEILDERPRFIVFRDHYHWWRTMLELQEDSKNPEDVDTDQEDHCYDETRYACMHRPVMPKKVDQIPPGSFAAERNRYLRAKRYAKRHGVSIQVAYQRVR